MRHLLIGTGLLLLAESTLAASVYRCVDELGQVSFSQQGCPGAQRAERHSASNPTPGSGKAVPLAQPATRERAPRPRDEPVLVVGEQDDGCGNRLTASERRSAIITRSIRSGMSRRDVESALGRPESVSGSDGSTRLRFRDGRGQLRTVTLDEHGCVRANKR